MAILIIGSFAITSILGAYVLTNTTVSSALDNHKQKKCMAKAITRIQANLYNR